MEEKVLYVTDLDGTLLNTAGRISENSITIINDLISEGMVFTYSTARSLISAKKVTQGLNTSIPVIVYNGAFIMNTNTGEILYRCGFTEEESANVKKILFEFSLHPLVYTFINGQEKVCFDVNYRNEGIDFYIGNRENDPRINPIQNDTELYSGDIFYFTVIGKQEELLKAYELLKGDSRYHCTLQQELYRPEYWLEIMPVKATKAEAIKQLRTRLNCDKVISFGDALNDLPMFDYADESYAVDNAAEELKEKAAGIISSNNEDGVAQWLKQNALR